MDVRSLRWIAVTVTTSLLFSVALIALLAGYGGVIRAETAASSGYSGGLEEGTTTTVHRKLLQRVAEPAMVEPNRIWGDNKCSKSDIVISQDPMTPLSSGIPTYKVEINNMCDCDISSIHLTCGWFSSARLIDPKLFKRLHYNDCLVNDGKALLNGGSVSFQYANTFLYPLSVSSVACKS